MGKFNFANASDEDEREVYYSIDGGARQLIGTIYKSWSRLGGWGWSINTSGAQTHKTMKDAARRLWQSIK